MFKRKRQIETKPPTQWEGGPNAAAIRAQAALENDPELIKFLLEVAAEIDRIEESFWRSRAEFEKKVAEIQESIEKHERRNDLPWWVVVLVLGLFCWGLLKMSVAGMQ